MEKHYLRKQEEEQQSDRMEEENNQEKEQVKLEEEHHDRMPGVTNEALLEKVLEKKLEEGLDKEKEVRCRRGTKMMHNEMLQYEQETSSSMKWPMTSTSDVQADMISGSSMSSLSLPSSSDGSEADVTEHR